MEGFTQQPDDEIASSAEKGDPSAVSILLWCVQ